MYLPTRGTARGCRGSKDGTLGCKWYIFGLYCSVIPCITIRIVLRLYLLRKINMFAFPSDSLVRIRSESNRIPKSAHIYFTEQVPVIN